MIMAVEERASEVALRKFPQFNKAEQYACEKGYIEGAKEQEEIDHPIMEEAVLRAVGKERKLVIDKVCDILADMLNDGTIETRNISKVNARIRKALEE